MHYVYKHYDNLDNLIYVGETKNPDMRRYNHRSNSYWMSMSAKEDVEEFKSKDDALEYEKMCIKAESPLFNTVYNDNEFFNYKTRIHRALVKNSIMVTKALNKKLKRNMSVGDLMSLSLWYALENEEDFLSSLLDGYHG